MGANNFLQIRSGIYHNGINTDTITTTLKRLFDNTIHENYIRNSYPAHDVTIEKISIRKRLITVTEFEHFVSKTGYNTEAEKEGWGWTWTSRWIKKEAVNWRSPFKNEADDIYHSNHELMPVLQVSWNDAAAYAKWLSSEQKKVYRLPREKEWEIFAALLGIPGMKDVEIPETSPMHDGQNKFILELARLTKYTPDTNYPGLIWEWCEDWFDAYPGGIDNREFGNIYKVLRGGSLLSHPVQKTREYRFRRCPTARSPYYGFRIALVHEKKKPNA